MTPSDPRRTDLYAGTRTWMVQHHLHPDPDAYLGHGYIDLGLRAWPTATGAPLHMATQWAVWTWRADDLLDQEFSTASPEHVSAVVRSLQGVVARSGSPTPSLPVAAALAELLGRTREIMPLRWQNRYERELLTWLNAARTKLAAFAQPGRTPTLREYQRLRPPDGGMLLAAQWCENAEQVVAPDWTDPLVQDLLASFSACGYLANDLASKPGEMFTAAAALARSAGLSREDAQERVGELLRAEEVRFAWLCTAVREYAQQPRQPRGQLLRMDTGRFAQILDAFRAALAGWTAVSSRYVLACPAESPQ